MKNDELKLTSSRAMSLYSSTVVISLYYATVAISLYYAPVSISLYYATVGTSLYLCASMCFSKHSTSGLYTHPNFNHNTQQTVDAT